MNIKRLKKKIELIISRKGIYKNKYLQIPIPLQEDIITNKPISVKESKEKDY